MNINFDDARRQPQSLPEHLGNDQATGLVNGCSHA